MLRAVKMWINCTVREEKVQIWILETTSLGSLRFCLCLSEPLLLRQLSQIGTWNLCQLHIMNDILRYDFYLYWTVVWQSSVMDVLVFSHRSVADVSWESISNMGCVVQACSNGITRIRGAWSCRQVTHTHTQVTVDDHNGTTVLLEWQKRPTAEKEIAIEGMLSTYLVSLWRSSSVTLCLYLIRDENPFVLQMIC